MKNLMLVLILIVFTLVLVSAEGFDVSVKLSPPNTQEEKSFEATPFVKVYVESGSRDIVIPITIKNLLDESQTFDIEYKNDEFIFVSFEDEEMLIEAKEEKKINVVLRNSGVSGVYISNIKIQGSSEEIYKIPVILQVVSKNPEFTVDLDVPLEYTEVVPGEKFVADAIIHNLGAGTSDVSLEFFISDLEGDLVASSDALELNVDFDSPVKVSRTLIIPADMPEGSYIAYASVKKDGLERNSAAIISVAEEAELSPEQNPSLNFYLMVSAVIIVVLIIAFLIINFYWGRKVVSDSKYWNKKLKDIKKIKFGTESREIRKLEWQKKLLESAHKKGYVKKGSYLDSKRKINMLIQGLKERL